MGYVVGDHLKLTQKGIEALGQESLAGLEMVVTFAQPIYFVLDVGSPPPTGWASSNWTLSGHNLAEYLEAQGWFERVDPLPLPSPAISKWSCGHRKEGAKDHCHVCAIFCRRTVTC